MPWPRPGFEFRSLRVSFSVKSRCARPASPNPIVERCRAFSKSELAATMVGAAITHGRRQEYPNMILNFVLMAMALFVAYGRFSGLA